MHISFEKDEMNLVLVYFCSFWMNENILPTILKSKLGYMLLVL